uniref:Uncharacterized protein n=4 Tax=Cercopithecinae TaxID=9528 RepID=A0A2K5XMU1_MANLE|nr:unnamed protein product [Macaca fascicularis]
MQHAQIFLLVTPSYLQQLGHLALKSPMSKEGQSPQPRHSMNMHPLSTRIPLRTPTCLPLPEDPHPS